MSKLDEILGKVGYGAGGDRESVPGLTDEQAKQQIKELVELVITKAHQQTTKANTMPLVSSYRAVDDMKKYALQEVEEL